jgi:hypothetical protein
MSKPARSMRAAIDAMCKSCIYDPHAARGTWRQQTEACSSKGCPLWQFRPISDRRDAIGPDPLPEQVDIASAPPAAVSVLCPRSGIPARFCTCSGPHEDAT